MKRGPPRAVAEHPDVGRRGVAANQFNNARSAGERHQPPLPRTDRRSLPVLTFRLTGSIGFVESLVGLQAEAAADDFLHDLGGAAENRLDAAQPPGPKLAPKSIGPGLRRTRPGCIWSAGAAAFAWRELARDHAPGDRLATPQLPEPRRGPDHHAEPAAPDIPAIDADVDSGELISA
jgi:hypothetical protein